MHIKKTGCDLPKILLFLLSFSGGTNDMVVHEVIRDDKIKEICAVNGGAYGGNRINENFINLLKDILGDSFIQSFQEKYPKEWFDFMARFERSKKIIENDGISRIKVDLPFSIEGEYAALKEGDSLKHTLKEAKDKGISFAAGSIILSHTTTKGLFTDTIYHIIQSVRMAFDEHEIEHIDCIFMVGGFCECTFLQHAVRKEFEKDGTRVLVPQEAQMAIIKGAVLFGHYQDKVVSRIARRTYGAGCAETFNYSIHDMSKFFIDDDGYEMCGEIFLPFVNKGAEIKTLSCVEKTNNLQSKQTSVEIPLYILDRIPKLPVEYTDSTDMIKLGVIRLRTPCTTLGKERRVSLKMIFGNTEILAEAVDISTGNKVSTTIDFISE